MAAEPAARKPPVVPRDVADKLLTECLGTPMAWEWLRTLCDDIGGRVSGTESGRRAEEWAADALRRVGLERVRFDPFEVPVWQRGQLDVHIAASYGWRLTALAHGFSPSECHVTAPVIDGGYGMPGDYERLGNLVQGAAVLCDEGAPQGKRTPHRTEKLAWAAAHGAAGLLLGGSAPGYLPRTGVCHPSGSPIPSIGLAYEDASRLRRLLADGLRPIVHIEMRNSLSVGVARNVLADLPGAELRDEFVLAGAHLDSWDVSQGATDNGLGCAILVQAAAALAACGKTPRRTLRFVLWAAEETGLRGSKHYVAEREDELERIVAVMNFDMTGDPQGYWVPGRNGDHPLLMSLASDLAPLGMRSEISTQPSLHSDHQPFLLAGVPIVCLAGRLPDGGGGQYYHSSGDTFEKVSLPGLCRAACVAAHTLWALADAPEAPYRRMNRSDITAMLERAGLAEAIRAEEGTEP